MVNIGIKYILQIIKDIVKVPKSEQEVLKDLIYNIYWKKAIKIEFNKLQILNSWEIVDLLLGKKSIDLKLVFDTKYTTISFFDYYKVRFIGQGFS